MDPFQLLIFCILAISLYMMLDGLISLLVSALQVMLSCFLVVGALALLVVSSLARHDENFADVLAQGWTNPELLKLVFGLAAVYSGACYFYGEIRKSEGWRW